MPAVRAAGDAALAAGDTARAEAHYRDLHDACDGLAGTLLMESRARVVDRRGWIAYLSGDVDHAATACARATELLALVLHHGISPYDVYVEARRAADASSLGLVSDRHEPEASGDVVWVCRVGHRVLRSAGSPEPGWAS